MPTYKIIPRETPADQEALKARSGRIVEALLGLGTTHVVGVVDNTSRYIFELFEAEPGAQVVPVCREGEAWSIGSGLWVGGAVPVVLIQNTGFLESGDALRGTAIQMGVPLVALIGYRGYRSLSSDSPDTAGSFFEPTLRAWDVPYSFLEERNEAENFRLAFGKARRERRPVAVLMT